MDLLALLFVVGICSSLASGNDVKPAPPEDEDGSGDDEDFSGSGMDGFFLDLDSKDGVFSTPVSSLVPAVTQLSTSQKPDIAVEEKTEENVTQHVQTTTPHDPAVLVIDPIGKEPFAEDTTTVQPTTQQASTVESVNDVKKHHHHHHHTTLPITSPPAKFDVDEATTSPSEVEKPFVAPEETTTSTPDEGDLDDLDKVTPTPEDSVKNVDQQETTSGLTSTAYAEKETTAGPEDIDDILAFVDSVEKTTVPDEVHTHKHHHHHHHHNTTTTAIPLDGSDLEATKKPDYIEPEDDQDQQGEATTTQSSEDKHHHHHHHHKHHHPDTTTPGTTESTVPEQFIVHSQDPKGRKVNIPPAEATSVVPVLTEDEDSVGSTVQYNNSVNPIQDEDIQDSTEEGSGNGPMDGEDIFFEPATAPVDNSDRKAAVPADGSADASQGIMERKELLAGIIAGGLAGLVFAASLVAFVLYRMKKKDEGSYSLEEPKQSNGGYQKPVEQREFYA